MHVVRAGPSGSEELGSSKEHAGNEEHAVSEEPGRSQDQSTVGKRLQIEGHAI